MMQVDRSNISRWVNEERDPSAEAVYEIQEALKQLSADAPSLSIEIQSAIAHAVRYRSSFVAYQNLRL